MKIMVVTPARFAGHCRPAAPIRKVVSSSRGGRPIAIVRFVDDKKEQHGSAVQDGIRILYDDHKHFRHVIDKYEKASSKTEKLETVRHLVKDLSAHSSVEQRYLYPLIVSKLNREDLQDRNYLDEKMNQLVLEWIDNHTPVTNEEWEVYDDTVHKLKTMLHEHMVEEERMVMKPLERVMSIEEKKELYNNIAWGKQHGPTHPHPESPQRPMASKVLDPVVGEVDKAVDHALGEDSYEGGHDALGGKHHGTSSERRM